MTAHSHDYVALRPSNERAFPIVVVGHVDHGKSTLIGRLLYDTGSLGEDRVAQLREASGRRGLDVEWSFLLDALQVERDQGITVDTTQVWFRSARRHYVIIDAPGHRSFLKNMVTGAARAEAAILVVDASQGVADQTRRHVHLLGLLGIGQIVVALNKVDLIGRDPQRVSEASEEIIRCLAENGLAATAIVPISARHGDNIVRAADMDGYGGPTLVDALDRLLPRASNLNLPFRFAVQDVYRLDDKRVVVGRIESGQLRNGDTIAFAPSGQAARVVSIETGNGVDRAEAQAGESVALTLDQPLFVERGQLAGPAEEPPATARRLRVRLFWLDAAPLAAGSRISLKLGTAEREATVLDVEEVLGMASMQTADRQEIRQHEVAQVLLGVARPLATDRHALLPRTGRGVFVRDFRVAGGFVVTDFDDAAPVEVPVELDATPGVVIWLTGYSGAGKSTLGRELVRRLSERGRAAHLLDGDELRRGLNRDLGFSDADRRENVRRVSEVARLFAEAGTIAVVSVIAPRAADRAMARTLVGPRFAEVHIRASLSACEQRDPKGLYARARRGDLKGFTGIDSPYETPVSPELVVDTEADDLATSADRLLAFVDNWLG